MSGVECTLAGITGLWLLHHRLTVCSLLLLIPGSLGQSGSSMAGCQAGCRAAAVASIHSTARAADTVKKAAHRMLLTLKPASPHAPAIPSWRDGGRLVARRPASRSNAVRRSTAGGRCRRPAAPSLYRPRPLQRAQTNLLVVP